jgi:probable HAF family extracellular repeat protein
MTDLGTLPGGDYSDAHSINASGQVVGTSTSALGLRAFLWTSADGMVDLNTLIPSSSNLVLTSAVAINDRGQILALGSKNHDLAHDSRVELDESPHHVGPTSVFLLTPLP